MKKRMVAMSVVAAAMTVAMSIPAFAKGWTQEGEGWRYYTDDNGWYISGQWFTDPEDGSIYHLDPDGYMMTETHVGGYWLGADGRRVEKTEEDIAREAEREARESSKSSPSKVTANAATAAKTATAAASTTRFAYQAEMKVFMDRIYVAAANSLGAIEQDTNLRAATVKNNLEETYRFVTTDGDNLLTSSLGLSTNARDNNYKVQSFDTSYNRALLNDEVFLTIFDKAFKDLAIAALGDTAGEAAYNYLFEQLNAGNYSFEVSNTTDAGNTYTMTCNAGTVNISVICSEYQESTETSAVEEVVVIDTATTTTPTSSVITVGAGKTATEDEDSYEAEDDVEDEDVE